MQAGLVSLWARPGASDMPPKRNRKVRLGKNTVSLSTKIYWRRKSRDR